MQKQSRRRFLQQTPLFVAAAGTIGLAAGCADPTATDTKVEAQDNNTTALPDIKLNSPIIAQVTDMSKGEIVLMIDAREVVFKDTEIVQRFMQALR